MNDQLAYILNNLWERHFELGRILRFRTVTRGRQATCYEILTGEHREFLAYLFPALTEKRLGRPLDWLGDLLAALDRERFSVMPMVKGRANSYVVDGPQNTRMMVGLNPVGQYLLPDQWTLHDLNQLGLRLGWMHRLLATQLPTPDPTGGGAKGLLAGLPNATTLWDQLHQIQAWPEDRKAKLGPIDWPQIETLQTRFHGTPAPGIVHGDMTPAAVLLDDDRQIRTIVDWSLLHPGDPLEDIIDAHVHWCLTKDGKLAREKAHALMQGYRSLRPVESLTAGGAVATWCAQRLVDAAHDLRPLPRSFPAVLAGMLD